MFFRRTKPKVQSFDERIELLRQAGFQTEKLAHDRVKISKHGVGAIVEEGADHHPQIDKAGILVGSEIAVLLSGGYQMFLELPSGQRLAASADQLHSLHEFEEDVKEALGLTNLYNTALGTTSQKHVYDRVYKRDSGAQPKPWVKKQNRISPKATVAKGSAPVRLGNTGCTCRAAASALRFKR
jgi:hypothetical protein